ncbi:MAG TPA: sigma-70 family RNA polymerase sigma factor [Planctomycetota bacterium]|nr:sigma-70 family RNA polymerase sigma factor [Planctomycetota bacterium]
MPTTEIMIEALIKMRQQPGGVPLDQFWKLVERFRAGLVHQGWVILGNQEDAEDVAQETLCQAYLHLDQLKDPNRLGAWLRGINRNLALNLRRRRARQKEERLATGQLGALEAPRKTTTHTRPVETLNAVLKAVDTLPEVFREVLVLRYWEKLNNDQIAERLEISPGTVRSRMCRADRMLAEKLKAISLQEEHPK